MYGERDDDGVYIFLMQFAIFPPPLSLSAPPSLREKSRRDQLCKEGRVDGSSPKPVRAQATPMDLSPGAAGSKTMRRATPSRVVAHPCDPSDPPRTRQLSLSQVVTKFPKATRWSRRERGCSRSVRGGNGRLAPAARCEGREYRRAIPSLPFLHVVVDRTVHC